MAFQKFTVSRDDARYQAWPDVVRTEQNKLICVFAECEHHLDRTDARIMLCQSTDRGRTWSPKVPLTEKGTKDDYFNCPRIRKLRDGRLAILCDRILGGESKGRAEQFLWLGDGEGNRWEAPIRLPFCGIVPELQQLSSGRLLIAAHFKGEASGKLEQYLWYSDDNGRTWSDRITVAAHPQLNLCEVSLLETDGGVLVAFLRENSRTGYDVLKALSFDGGETWSEIYPTPLDCGHRPVAGHLQDGRVMITYRYIPNATQNTFAGFFEKESLTETERGKQRVRIFPLDYDRNPSPDLGYTGWVQFPDGEIYVVNYIKDDADKAYIRGYAFFPEDVLFSKTATATKNVF